MTHAGWSVSALLLIKSKIIFFNVRQLSGNNHFGLKQLRNTLLKSLSKFTEPVDRHRRRAGLKEVFNPMNPKNPMFFIFFTLKNKIIRNPGRQEMVFSNYLLVSWIPGFLRAKSIKSNTGIRTIGLKKKQGISLRPEARTAVKRTIVARAPPHVHTTIVVLATPPAITTIVRFRSARNPVNPFLPTFPWS
jgi:hypothetical protein